MTIVKYKNILNSADFKEFGVVELRIFFAVCSHLKDEETNMLTISQKDILPYITSGTVVQYQQFHKALVKLNQKMQNFILYNKFDLPIKLFSVFFVDEVSHEITVQLNDEVESIFSFKKGTHDTTSFNVEDLLAFRSPRATNTFRIFSQWKDEGEIELSVQKMKDIFGVEKKGTFYRTLREIKTKFPKYLAEFELLPVRKGRSVVGYRATWNTELTYENDKAGSIIFDDFISRPITISFDE